MANTNYASVHSTIKTSLENSGFKYITADQWFNLDFGIFPEALKGNSVSIKFTQQSTSDFNTGDWCRLSVHIEFVLEAMKDAYLTRLDDCVAAIEDLRGVITGGDIRANNISENFTATYLADRLLVNFSEITIEIKTITGG